MICPTCKSDMIVIEHEDIELDYCPSCRGVWFDSGELELLLEGFGLPSENFQTGVFADAEEAKAKEKKRKCPVCGDKMKKVFIGEDEQTLIDVCTRGDGLWFDGGEVQYLVKHLGGKGAEQTKSRQKVFNFLGEVFKA